MRRDKQPRPAVALERRDAAMALRMEVDAYCRGHWAILKWREGERERDARGAIRDPAVAQAASYLFRAKRSRSYWF